MTPRGEVGRSGGGTCPSRLLEGGLGGWWTGSFVFLYRESCRARAPSSRFCCLLVLGGNLCVRRSRCVGRTALVLFCCLLWQFAFPFRFIRACRRTRSSSWLSRRRTSPGPCTWGTPSRRPSRTPSAGERHKCGHRDKHRERTGEVPRDAILHPTLLCFTFRP